MPLADAFNFALSKHSRPMTLTDGTLTVSIKATPVNFTRQTAGPSETVHSGKEFILSKAVLAAQGWTGKVARGHFLTDSELGRMAIVESEPMYDVGAAIIAYKVRTN